jgi:HPt (histidine-containing phosphotransfer) domain-containing protein
MIDRQKFNDTFQYFDREVILNIIDIFEQELPERFEKIEKSIREKDFDALAFSAHSLKSVAGTFLAAEPSDLSRKMEERAIQKTGDGMEQLYVRLKAAMEELLRELMVIRSELLSEDPTLQIDQ